MTTPYCECGCGGITSRASQTKARLGHVKGEHVRFLQGHGGSRGKKPTPIKDRFWPLVNKAGPGECWLWTGSLTGNGYGRINQGKQLHLAHRVAYELTIGPIPAGLIIRHTCDIPPCVNPAHLLTGTYAENMGDAVDRDRMAHGERVHCAKLTAESVVEIRKSNDGGQSISSLSREHQVSRSTIRNAVRGKTWARVA